MIKKYSLGILVLWMLGAGMASCDDEPVSKKHVYTEEEQAYKDSVEAAQSGVNADYAFSYDVEIAEDTVNYSGAEITIEDTTTLLEKLGYATMADLAAAMGSFDDDGNLVDNEIDFYAISGSTGYDYNGAYTANGFGYWFNASGDVCSWGDGSVVYTEMDAETFTFTIGQFPGAVASGDTYQIAMVAINADDYRVGFVFNITITDMEEEEEEEEPDTDVETVSTYDLSATAVVDTNYVVTEVAYDFDAVADDLGITTDELSENMLLYSLNNDGSVITDYTANYGFWYDLNGDVTSWGTDGCAFYVEYSTEEDGIFNLGQFPKGTTAGTTYTCSLGLVYGGKMVVFNISYEITAE